MIGGQRGFLLPTAIVAYVALAVFASEAGSARYLLLLAPLGVALSLRFVERGYQSGKLLGSPTATRALVFGVGLFAASFFAASRSSGLDAAQSAALLACSAGALLAIARVEGPPGLLRGQRVAQSRDALLVAMAVWSLTTMASLLATLFPQYVDLDPLAFDAALVFAVLGSLLLFCAAEVRVLLLRGLELGVADRARSSLSLGLAGTLVAVGASWVDVAPAERVAAASLVLTAVGIVLTKLVVDAAVVTRAVRATLGLILLGAPVALLGAHFAMSLPEHPASVAFATAALSLLAGLMARSLAAPLGPEGSRWLVASEQAMDAALQPEPDVALREALRALRVAEPTSEARPELFRVEPEALLSVDVAGYLSTRKVEFPRGVLLLALGEPELTLRRETVQRAQIRDPKVRPIVAWFESWGAKTATALIDDEGGVGLLVLPAGKRKSNLALEEAQALGRLGRRMTGLLAVNSALARSRHRELEVRKSAEQSLVETADLRARLDSTERMHSEDAAALFEVLTVAGHSPRARICLQEIENANDAQRIEFTTPPGVDPRPWAAHFHLSAVGVSARGPLVVFDATQKGARDPASYADESARGLSPVTRAQGGTLLLLQLGALPPEAQDALAEALMRTPVRLVVSRDPRIVLSPALCRAARGSVIALPALADRPEDLRSLVLFELARIGLAQRGSPFGMDRGAFAELIERPFHGNDEELRGLLLAAAARAQSDVIGVADLVAHEPDEPPIPSPPEDAPMARSRSRRPPRSRRP